MQYCEQGDLFKFITTVGLKKVSEEQKWIWLSQLASAMYYLH